MIIHNQCYCFLEFIGHSHSDLTKDCLRISLSDWGSVNSVPVFAQCLVSFYWSSPPFS